jgi:CBS domain containing-hemolysin-like protein
VAKYGGHIVLMLLLLAGSAFFSGAETAFFNLSRREKILLHKSTHRLQHLVGRLLDRPSRLLGCLLLGNMTVNVLFFAVGSTLTAGVRRQVGMAAAATTAVVTFSALVLFGELLPKSLAYANSKSLSIAAALPAYLSLRFFNPVVHVFRVLIVEPTLRLILGPGKQPEPVTTSEFRTLVDHVGKRGLLSRDENKLLTEIIELGFLKVRHVMRPRVDMIACAVTEPPGKAVSLMQENHCTKLPVYVRSIDNIVGIVHLRHVLLNPDTSLDKLVQRIHFVPEQKTVESLLEFFRRSHTDIAVVVDEYGGIAGSVRLEDIAEELLGPIEPAEQVEPIKAIGPFEYRLTGDLPVRDWAAVFGIKLDETRLATIGGLVTALLGRIPRSGDVARLKNLKFTVETVRKHRIETLILTLEPNPDNG